MSLEQKIKKILKTGLVIGGCLLGSLAYSSKAEAVEIVEQQITSNAADQWWPAIYENKVVWYDANMNIYAYMFDSTTEVITPICTDPGFQAYPRIYQDKVVWLDWRNGNQDIYMYDLATGIETQITADPANQGRPDIYGDKIVYNYNKDIYMYDLTTGIETRITTSPANQDEPAIYQDKIIWRDYRNGNWDIYMYDLATGIETPICTDPAGQYYPAIHGDKIVWTDNRNGNDDIYMYDLTNNIESQITSDIVNQYYYPDIHDNKIVYQDDRNGNNDIYMYDLGPDGLFGTGDDVGEVQITTNISGQSYPAVYGTKIVYQDNRNGNADIYMYDLTTGLEKRVSDLVNQENSDIHSNKIVWMDSRNGRYYQDIDGKYYFMYDIFMYDLGPDGIFGNADDLGETQITASGRNGNPAINGDKIVWHNSGLAIEMYNITTGITNSIKSTLLSVEYPDIYGSKIVWQDFDSGSDWDIHMYDLGPDGLFGTGDDGGETQITTDPADQLYPKIHQGKIVWVDWRNGNADIYMYDIPTGIETQITTITADQRYPDIYSNKIVWQDNRNGNWDIYMYDLTTGIETQITTNIAAQERSKIYQNGIVYHDNRDGNWDIYMYDLKTNEELQLTTNISDQQVAAIYENKVVWTDNRNGDLDIYMATMYCDLLLFSDDMEIGENNWQHYADQGIDDWSIVNFANSHSPTQSWYTSDVNSVKDAFLVTRLVNIVSNSELTFWHSYEFDADEMFGYYYDGGVIEISTNYGLSWYDLGPYIMVGGYNGTINTGSGNPIEGRDAWTGGTIGEMTQVRVDLSSFNGPNRKIRFRIGCDNNSFGAQGWYIDDVQISSCLRAMDKFGVASLAALLLGLGIRKGRKGLESKVL